MYGVIDDYNFAEMEAQKYYSPPASWDDAKKRDNARTKIMSGDFLGAEKRDGFFAKIVKDEDGNIMIFSRSRGVNGQFANKFDWVPQLHYFLYAIPAGTCILGELYLPSAPGSKNVSTILGCLKDKAIARQEKGEKLHLYIFDVLAYDNKSFMGEGAEYRFNNLHLFDDVARDYVEIAKYYYGQELWTNLQNYLADGREGVVICHRDGKYEPGKRPSKTTLKIKKELKQTIDCFFTGNFSAPNRIYTGKELESWMYWENERTGEKIYDNLYKDYTTGAPVVPITKYWFSDWCGSMEIAVLRDKEGRNTKINDKIYKNKEIYSLGWISGITDDLRANPRAFEGKIIEVNAMEIYDDGKDISLRHGRLIGFRDDLTIEDCTFEKILG